MACPSKRMEGRGAYVCPDLHCYRIATKRGGFAKSFRSSMKRIEPEALAFRALDLERKELVRLLDGARRSGWVDVVLGEREEFLPERLSLNIEARRMKIRGLEGSLSKDQASDGSVIGKTKGVA